MGTRTSSPASNRSATLNSKAPAALPDWSGKHLLPIRPQRPRTGTPRTLGGDRETTPMYQACRQDREHRIRRPLATAATAYIRDEHRPMANALERLTDAMWHNEVVTAQGVLFPRPAIRGYAAASYGSMPATCHRRRLHRVSHDFVDALIDDALTRRRTGG